MRRGGNARVWNYKGYTHPARRSQVSRNKWRFQSINRQGPALYTRIQPRGVPDDTQRYGWRENWAGDINPNMNDGDTGGGSAKYNWSKRNPRYIPERRRYQLQNTDGPKYWKRGDYKGKKRVTPKQYQRNVIGSARMVPHYGSKWYADDEVMEDQDRPKTWSEDSDEDRARINQVA